MAFNADNTGAILFASEQVNKAIGIFGDSTGMMKSFDEGGSAIHNYLYSYIGGGFIIQRSFERKKLKAMFQ